ncbi:ribonuclease H [Microbacterium sp. JZ37]|uniref:ribonuclease H family protein n=1 Tax=Microbacterium sp. JZ37 TaxID=2654193 RepID=UPI002B48A16A|nr:ribonuclease H [Microbacterium sp. JZ37]WRH17027.1 ribonuclease HI [Microbacterium sp. JZ37]
MRITAAADGSALGNPGPMGWAWYIDDERWAAGGSPHGTNNQGELQAVLELLRATADAGIALLIECDSRYVIDSVTKWMPGWKRKGWRKADGKPVLNRELLQGIDEAMQGRDVVFSWVKGHAGHPLNEAADERANAAAQAFQRRAEPNRGPGFAADPVEGVSGGAVVAPEPPAASGPSASAAPAPTAVDEALWGADDELALFPAPEEEMVELRLLLAPDELARLRARAASWGISPEDALRRLI